MYVMPKNQTVPPGCQQAVVAIGNFDGVHLGHQKLLEAAEQQAKTLGKPLGVLTFEPHPRSLFRPDEPVFRLSPPAWKARLLKGLGVQCLDVATFDRDLAGLEAEEFVKQILVERLAVCHVVTGYDFHFGRGRKGSPDTMRQLGKQYGFGVTIVDQVTDDDGVAPFSSSAIRTALRRGHVQKAASQLGHWWSIMGTVVKGDQRGRSIGYPTINMALEPGCEPHEGIYAVRVRSADRNDTSVWNGAGYIGYRPTFETEQLFLEVFIFDFDKDVYGQEFIVEFIDFIRPDKRFDTLDGLLEQMKKDCQQIETQLSAFADNNPVKNYPLGALQAEGKL
ncbi:FMN adenylyltransferase / Riboflavin kinase [hydrothermal vent metagenome]|uniref:Bifunctional riboflavin kinase/FMN adenylyltransferase n=1 Tax=hydrothermal vent metagenome TaxID=652676 RepID=A0A3B0R887_9ZZZZ